MPAMTMVFPVKDPALLDKAKPGQRVRFQAEMIGGTATVTQLEPVK
jgi:Cu/Ag efflux protein CusF